MVKGEETDARDHSWRFPVILDNSATMIHVRAAAPPIGDDPL